MAPQVINQVTDRDYPYVVVRGVRTGPAIAVGESVALSYVDMTPEEALTFVSNIHPNVDVTSVVNYYEN